MSHRVQVVSILEVTRRLGEWDDQEKDVSGGTWLAGTLPCEVHQDFLISSRWTE